MPILRNDSVVCIRCNSVYDRIYYAADYYANAGSDDQARYVKQSEQHEQLVYYWQHHCQVYAGEDDRYKEYRQHLRVDAFSYIFFCHTDLLHYVESGLILEAFRDLLVIHDDHA